MSRPRTAWATTDWHIGHDKIVTHCGRPAGFEGEIIRKHKRLCDVEGDILFNLGDLMWYRDPWIDFVREFNRSVRCTSVLVLGNHDRETRSKYFGLGFHLVVDGIVWKDILLTHRPTPPPPGLVNVHGHWHDNPADQCLKFEKHLYDFSRQFRLSLEESMYGPVKLEEWVSRKRREVA